MARAAALPAVGPTVDRSAEGAPGDPDSYTRPMIITGQRRMRASWRAWLSGDTARLGPWWVNYAWTIVFGTMCAIGFTFLNVALNAGDAAAHPSTGWTWFRINMIISLSIALSIRLMFAAGARVVGNARLRGWGKARRSVYFTIVPALGTAIGWPLGLYWAIASTFAATSRSTGPMPSSQASRLPF